MSITTFQDPARQRLWWFLDHPRVPAAVVLLGSFGLLGGALLFQYVGGLHPCELCVWQRWPHAVAQVLAAVALAAPTNGPHRARQASASALGLAGLVLWIGAGIAVYHVGVEQQWWAASAACGGSSGATSLEELRAMVLAAPVVRCTDVSWSLFGISMAGWNVLFSLALGGVAIAAAARTWMRRPA